MASEHVLGPLQPFSCGSTVMPSAFAVFRSLYPHQRTRTRAAFCLADSLCLDQLPLLLEFDVFPRVGVARGDRWKHVLPFLGCDAWTNCVHEGVTEYRHEIVVFQDCPL